MTFRSRTARWGVEPLNPSTGPGRRRSCARAACAAGSRRRRTASPTPPAPTGGARSGARACRLAGVSASSCPISPEVALVRIAQAQHGPLVVLERRRAASTTRGSRPAVRGRRRRDGRRPSRRRLPDRRRDARARCWQRAGRGHALDHELLVQRRRAATRGPGLRRLGRQLRHGRRTAWARSCTGRGTCAGQIASRHWRLTSPRIVGTANVENACPRAGSNRRTALTRPR